MMRALGLICRINSMKATPNPDSTMTVPASRIQLDASLGRRDL
jgi:hypothetical protein